MFAVTKGNIWNRSNDHLFDDTYPYWKLLNTVQDVSYPTDHTTYEGVSKSFRAESITK
jgi:hypothetical protein